MVDPPEVGQEADQIRAAMREGIEQADLDVRMGVERGDGRVEILQVDVVDQDPHAHAAVGSANEAVDEVSAGRVGFPEEVLDVESLLREVGERDAGGKSGAPVANDAECGVAGMLRGDLGDPSADRRGLVILHRRRRRARIVGRETCAACKHRENEREHNVPPHRFAVSVAHRASRRRGPRRERLILVGSGTFPAVHLDRHVRGSGIRILR